MVNDRIDNALQDEDTRGEDSPIQRTYGKHSTFFDLMRNTQNFYDGKNIRTAMGGAVKVWRMELTPYLGTNMLMVTAESKGDLPNSSDVPHVQLIRAMNMKFMEEETPGYIKQVYLKTDQVFWVKPIQAKSTPIDVYCSCGDFQWRFAYWIDKRLHSLATKLRNEIANYKRKTPPPPAGRPYVNPAHVPGLCKHLITVGKLLHQRGLIV